MKKIVEKIMVYLIFFVIFLFLFSKVTLLFVRKGNGYGTDILDFYRQKNNSIDVLVLGSSHSYSAVNPYLIEELTGLSTYDFCTQQQPIWITYYYLKEALKTQKPKYVILDVHMVAFGDTDYASESVNRDAIDKMKMSKNKISVINISVEKLKDRESFFFNIIKYHTRYKELTNNDYEIAFNGKTVDNKGYIKLPKTNYVFSKASIDTSDSIELYSKNSKYFNLIIDLAKRENINLILIKTPAIYKNDMIKKLNTIKSIAYQKNILFLNYIENIDALDLNYNNDFYDDGHLNEFGSVKFTKKLIEDIKFQD